MQEQNLNEIWQVDVNGTVYEAPFVELGDWIDGGSLLPEDKVRKGNLRWIEARKVPSLVPFFNAKASGQPMPMFVNTTVAEPPAANSEPPTGFEPHIESSPFSNNSEVQAADSGQMPGPEVCVLHTEMESFYLCDGCGSGLCKACPKSFGGTVKICPLCGAMCRPKLEVAAVKSQTNQKLAALADGFGIADFFSALGHPFKFKVSLFFGAAMFAAFSLGQSASALGGIFMMVSAIFCMMLANMLTFGVLSHTVDNFVQGNLEENFMPSFEEFSIWDDVVHPFFLSIGAYLSSFGPFILVALIGFYLVTRAISSQAEIVKAEIERIPGTQVYAGRKLTEQTGEVKDVLNGIKQREQERIAVITESADAANSDSLLDDSDRPVIDRESKEQEELWAMAQESRKVQLESALGKSPETEAREQSELLKGFLSLAAPLVVVGLLTLIWGLVMFPASCAVAGYTRSFLATINPLVALDTMRRLGLTYVKILVMCVALLFLSILVSGILSMIFAPFALPGMGNLPAKGLGSMFGFYLTVVFSCILGYALFKSQDKLQLRA